MTPDDFRRGLKALSVVFNRPAEPEFAESYWQALRDLDGPTWEAAVARAVRESLHFPRPAELRGLPTCGPVRAGWSMLRPGVARWRLDCPHEPPCQTPERCSYVTTQGRLPAPLGALRTGDRNGPMSSIPVKR